MGRRILLVRKVNAIDDFGPLGKFINRPASKGSHNKTGSVHESYTKDDAHDNGDACINFEEFVILM